MPVVDRPVVQRFRYLEQGLRSKQFSFSRKNFTNKVIPKYWGGYRTTQELLQKEKIDYIVNSGQIVCDDCNTYGTLIYKDKTIKTPKIYHNWQIWKVDNKP